MEALVGKHSATVPTNLQNEAQQRFGERVSNVNKCIMDLLFWAYISMLSNIATAIETPTYHDI